MEEEVMDFKGKPMLMMWVATGETNNLFPKYKVRALSDL